MGGLTVLLNNAIVVGFTEIAGLHYLQSILLTTLLTTFVGFALNRQWTFRKGGRMEWRELGRYLAGVMWSLGLIMALTWGLVRLGLPYYLACLMLAALMAPINFILHRQWSFGLGRRVVPSAKAL